MGWGVVSRVVRRVSLRLQSGRWCTKMRFSARHVCVCTEVCIVSDISPWCLYA